MPDARQYPLMAFRRDLPPQGELTSHLVVRPRALSAVNVAVASDRRVLIVAPQRDSNLLEPGPSDLFETALLGTVEEVFALPNGQMMIRFLGRRVVHLGDFVQLEPHFVVTTREP